MKKYQIKNGVSYDARTPNRVVFLLANALGSHTRLRLHYGDTKSGKSWFEENDTIGYIGRSTGEVKIPLLIKNNRSTGGGGILDHCIIGIQNMAKTWLYKHPTLQLGSWSVTIGSTEEGYDAEVLESGKVHARFKTVDRATKYVAFMRGERMNY